MVLPTSLFMSSVQDLLKNNVTFWMSDQRSTGSTQSKVDR